MEATLERAFIATHTLHGVLVMRNPDFKFGPGGTSPRKMWVDADGNTYPSGAGNKATPLVADAPMPAAIKVQQYDGFGHTHGKIGEVIPSDWYQAHYAQIKSPKGVMVTREAAAAALRASAWPDSDSPCGNAGNSKDDDAAFEGKDAEGNCIVKLFMRGKGYFKVKIPAAMFLEIVDE